MDDNTKSMNVQLYFRLLEELQEYENELLTYPGNEILKNAYEYVIRQDIVFALECNDISEKQAEALLKYEHPLEEIYNRWEHTDSHYMERILDVVKEKANEMLRVEYIAQHKKDKSER